jgi:hypothetical protein
LYHHNIIEAENGRDKKSKLIAHAPSVLRKQEFEKAQTVLFRKLRAINRFLNEVEILNAELPKACKRIKKAGIAMENNNQTYTLTEEEIKTMREQNCMMVGQNKMNRNTIEEE